MLLLQPGSSKIELETHVFSVLQAFCSFLRCYTLKPMSIPINLWPLPSKGLERLSKITGCGPEVQKPWVWSPILWRVKLGNLARNWSLNPQLHEFAALMHCLNRVQDLLTLLSSPCTSDESSMLTFLKNTQIDPQTREMLGSGPYPRTNKFEKLSLCPTILRVWGSNRPEPTSTHNINQLHVGVQCELQTHVIVGLRTNS